MEVATTVAVLLGAILAVVAVMAGTAVLVMLAVSLIRDRASWSSQGRPSLETEEDEPFIPTIPSIYVEYAGKGRWIASTNGNIGTERGTGNSPEQALASLRRNAIIGFDFPANKVWR